mgnify:CR=1 FL=1
MYSGESLTEKICCWVNAVAKFEWMERKRWIGVTETLGPANSEQLERQHFSSVCNLTTNKEVFSEPAMFSNEYHPLCFDSEGCHKQKRLC